MTDHRLSGGWRRSLAQWLVMGLGILAVVAVFLWVDLSPRVESDFFFSRDDPQLRALQEMERRFPAPAQVLLRIAGPDIEADSYVSRLEDLTAELQRIPGVASVSGISNEDVRSPLWNRLLLNEDSSASNIIVSVPDPHTTGLIPGLEAAVQQYDAPDFEIEVSGVPYIVELIRRSLLRDLVVFSSAAFVLFGLLVGLVYRERHVVLGTLTTCIMACAVTLCVTQLLHVGIGLLTANIAVIVFVLTLSHIVFLTSNWRQAAADHGTVPAPVERAVTQTIGPSFWCMLTTTLGFLSLLLASAKPLRELGVAGAIGTLTALMVAYGVYPTFLRSVRPPATHTSSTRGSLGLGTLLPSSHGGRWLAAIAAVVLTAGAGLRHLSTDPTLLSYFAPGSELRNGLEAVDSDGGSSPLLVAVRDPDGNRVDTDEMNEKMWTLQERLENDSSVGVTISPALLLAHAKTVPFAAFLPWSRLLDILESPFVDRVGRSFVTPDREQGRFFLRMREAERTEPRAEVIARITRHAEESGLEVALLAGHYELQGQLGQLIFSSLRIGLGGLLLLFIGIAFAVSRSIRLTVAMFLCLLGIPALVLGTAGHMRMPIDIITSPAANVALAMGVDSMIHLAMRVRRLGGGGAVVWGNWLEARAQLWRPILGATLIICAGFGIFSLSSFPPTQRFGFAVILGTLTAATMALVALPFAATVHRSAVRR